MRSGRLQLGLLLWSVLLCACGTAPIRGNVRGNAYVVQSGDTLYSIAIRAGMDYRQLARLNQIGSDYRIYPGQRLLLSGGSVADRTTATGVRNPPVSVLGPASVSWIWPTHAQGYAPTIRPNGGVGLVINGRAGQDVVAAASGQVIYSGTGLLGYGRLVIIKHDESWLSAYAHLQQSLVVEGTQVTTGQKIATLGTDRAGTPMLYFEMRINGVPVEPLPRLPKQK